jgi:hypothetical protein
VTSPAALSRLALGRWSAVPWAGPAAAAAAAAGACTVLAVADPEQSSLYPPCPFRALTGLHCPGCGTLRALRQLVTGHPGAALGLNPLTVLLLPVVAYAWVAWAGRSTGRPLLPRLQLPARAVWGLLAVVAVFWLLRNLPLAPFTALAP